jgi:hypothetical protein
MESSGYKVDATDAVSISPESDVVLDGAQIPAGCGTESRTQQITRKRLHKTLALDSQESILAMTPLRRPFLLITRKEIVRSAKLREQGNLNELRRSAGANLGTGGVRPRATGLVLRRGVCF